MTRPITVETDHMQPPVKCLLVDDLPENLLALEVLLRQDGVELFSARTGAEALELLLVHDFALALVDVQMPEMDGFELAELMRGSARTRHVPIIFVTAVARDRERLFKGYDAGAVDFLYKPLEPRVVCNKVGVFFELYRQRRLLAERLDELTQTLRLNEMFTAVLGHDLRNPLSTILASAGAIEHHAPENSHLRRPATRIISSSRRMGRLIDDMLDLARARLAGGLAIDRRELDLGELVEKTLDEHRGASPDARLELTFGGLLDCQLDGDRVSQLASNLVGNAIQHRLPNTDVHVHLDGTNSDRVRIVVANEGTIDPEHMNDLFDPFVSASSHRRNGLGLGLYIAQQICLAHRGRIGVESCEGETKFIADLPRRATDVVQY